MNPFALLNALPQLEALAPRIEWALDIIERYKKDQGVKDAITTAQRLINDPEVKKAIATVQRVLADPNVDEVVNIFKQLDGIIIKAGITS